MALCTVEDVKSFLSIDGTLDANEDLVENLIDQVSKAIETFCDRTFDSTEHTEYINGEGRYWIRPKHYPITAVAGVWDDENWSWGTQHLIDSSTYRISSDGRFIISRLYSFTDAVENVKIIYTAGYSTIPLDLKMVCVDKTASLYKSRANRHLTSYSNVDGENLVFNTMAFSDDMKIILERYLNKC